MMKSHDKLLGALRVAVAEFEATGDHSHAGAPVPGDCIACAVRIAIGMPAVARVVARQVSREECIRQHTEHPVDGCATCVERLRIVVAFTPREAYNRFEEMREGLGEAERFVRQQAEKQEGKVRERWLSLADHFAELAR